MNRDRGANTRQCASREAGPGLLGADPWAQLRPAKGTADEVSRDVRCPDESIKTERQGEAIARQRTQKDNRKDDTSRIGEARGAGDAGGLPFGANGNHHASKEKRGDAGRK